MGCKDNIFITKNWLNEDYIQPIKFL